MILPLILAALSSAPMPPPSPGVARPDQFDLICHGISERQLYDSTSAGRLVTYIKRPVMDPWSGTFHVDMARGLWCQDKCTEVASPAVAKPQVMVLTETDRHGARRRTVFETPDGVLLVLEAAGTSIKPVRGRCTLSAFTGIPDGAERIGAPLNLKAEPYPQD
ncbi:MAG: hypothetical protein ACYDD1_16060 [Caulobacteraceae bacterium]